MNKLTQEAFGELVGQLQDAVVGAIEVVMSAKGLSFDVPAFRAETSINLDDLAREACFYGAAVFPSDDDEIVAIAG